MIARLLNESCRPAGEVEAILAWTLGQVGKLEHGRVAVKVVDTDVHGAHGFAFGRDHRRPKWAGRFQYGVRLAIPTGAKHYDLGCVCWHSAAVKKAPADHVQLLYEAGEKRLGRWPIYVIHDWHEDLVHLAAHEFQHILSFDRGDRVRVSEIRCELTAERVLNQWRRDLPLKGGTTTTTTTANPPSITLAKMGDGDTWHVLAGIVTDDIAKAACGLRRVPVEVEADIDSRAVRHRGANVCAKCRTQIPNEQGGTTVSKDMTDTLTKQAGKAAQAGPAAAGTAGKSTATAAAEKSGDKPKKKRGKRGSISTLAAAELVLRREGKPLHVKEITQRVIAMPETKLGGKTPDATVGAILAVSMKKPGSPFRRTKPSTYAIKKGK